MDLQMGDTWYGKQGTAYEGIQGTIDHITARYVQISFTPALMNPQGSPVHGKPIGKRQFRQDFTRQPHDHQLTIFDILDG